MIMVVFPQQVVTERVASLSLPPATQPQHWQLLQWDCPGTSLCTCPGREGDGNVSCRREQSCNSTRVCCCARRRRKTSAVVSSGSRSIQQWWSSSAAAFPQHTVSSLTYNKQLWTIPLVQSGSAQLYSPIHWPLRITCGPHDKAHASQA